MCRVPLAPAGLVLCGSTVGVCPVHRRLTVLMGMRAHSMMRPLGCQQLGDERSCTEMENGEKELGLPMYMQLRS